MKREIDEGEEGMYAKMESDGDGFGKVGILMGGDMKMKNSAKEFDCGDEVVEEILFAITDEIWLTGKGE